MSSERRILNITCVAHFLTHYFELLYPAMTMFVVRDLGVGEHQVITAGFGLYMFYGVLAIPAGVLGDRWSPAAVMSAGILVAGVGSIGAGIWATIPGLWLCLAVVGMGISTYHPNGMALLSKGIVRRGRALGINGVWGNVGIVTGPLVGAVGGYFVGWRTVLVVSGCAGVVVGVVGLLLRIRIHRDEEKTPTTPLSSAKAGVLFTVLLVVMAIGGTLYRATIVTLPVYFEERAATVVEVFDHLPLPEGAAHGDARTMGAGLLLSLACLLGIVGQRLGGAFADRYDLSRGYLLFLSLALPGLVAMTFAEGFALVVAVAWFLLFFLGMQPIENSLVARLTPTRWRSTSYGMKFTVTFGLGSTAVWLVSIAQSTQWGTPFVFVALSVLMLAVIAGAGVLAWLSRGVSMRQGTPT